MFQKVDFRIYLLISLQILKKRVFYIRWKNKEKTIH